MYIKIYSTSFPNLSEYWQSNIQTKVSGEKYPMAYLRHHIATYACH